MEGKPVWLTPGAREDLLQAVDFHDEQASLGADLYAEVQDCLRQASLLCFVLALERPGDDVWSR